MNTHRKQSERAARQGVIEGVVLRPAASVVGFVGPEPDSSFDLRMWKKKFSGNKICSLRVPTRSNFRRLPARNLVCLVA